MRIFNVFLRQADFCAWWIAYFEFFAFVRILIPLGMNG